MTVNELRTFLKDYPDEWEVNVVKDDVYPIRNMNSIGMNSEYYKSGSEGYCIRGPQVFLEI